MCVWEREKEKKRKGVSKWNTRELYPLIKIVSIFFALLWLVAAQLSQERGEEKQGGECRRLSFARCKCYSI